LLIATTNPNKLREIRPLLAGLTITLQTLADFPPVPEPEETGDTFWENARIMGPNASYPDRFTEIWRRLNADPSKGRAARFVTALALVDPSRILFETETSVAGTIADRAAGEHGFG